MFKFINNKTPNILVIGDIILDNNVFGSINKIANEAPIPVFNKSNEVLNLGGCGNVLNNLYNFGCNELYIMSVIGDDNSGKNINKIISNKKINNLILTVQERVTTLKKRFYIDKHLVFRCDEEELTIINENIENYFINKIREIKSLDCIIFSDYNKGVLTERLCNEIINYCNAKGILTIVDPKDNFYKYKNCSLIKPNRKEAIQFCKFEGEILDMQKYLKREISCKYSVITLAEKGLCLYDGENLYSSNIDSKEIVDVTGAGDVVCSLLGYLISISNNLNEIIKISNYLATASVQHLGVYNINIDDVENYKNNNKTKTISFEDLKFIDKRKKIVFTNGCFDLLHKGHLECLKFSKSLGDILIVGVNSDSSVKKIKGEKRPIQDENIRCEILESLSFTDYIIKFQEETPIEIIKVLKPYILVKGGDYKGKNIVGQEYCKELIFFDYINNISTTNTIKKISL